jgi:hypothetical protein
MVHDVEHWDAKEKESFLKVARLWRNSGWAGQDEPPAGPDGPGGEATAPTPESVAPD